MGNLFIFNSKELIKRILINIFFVIIVVFLLDLIIGKTLNYLYFKETSGIHYRTTYSIDSTVAELLVFGASKANRHYDSELFEKDLGLSSYNCGRDGSSILYSYALFKAVTKRYKPKIIIFDINPSELFYDTQSYDRLSSLLPYYKNHSEIQDIIELRSHFERIKLISKIYPYNSSLLTIGIGNMEFNKKRKGDNLGYVPLFNSIIDTTIHNIEIDEGILDKNKLSALSDLIKYCKTANINLVFIQSPMYACVSNSKSTEFVEKMTNGENVIFWNYINDHEFLSKPEYFQDQYHLNDKGAKYFSRQVISKLKNINSN